MVGNVILPNNVNIKCNLNLISDVVTISCE